MDFNQIGNAIGSLALGLAGLGTFLSSRQRAVAKKYRRLRVDADQMEDYILKARRDRRLHNEVYHPDGGSDAIEVPPLPDCLSRIGDDDE